MDKFLRPDRFEADPNSASATKEWTHWFKTFENFLHTAKIEEETDKLKLLINYVSHKVYDIICDCKDYNEATTTLGKIYIKQSNEVFARYLLATRKQHVGESIDQYLQALNILSKDCNFKDVTAEQNKNDNIRDSFINGLLSRQIRQRLLENTTLKLDEAVRQSRSLEDAQKHSEAYSSIHNSLNSVYSVYSIKKEEENNSEVVDELTTAVISRKCYFCGNNQHARNICPARNQTCGYCKKIGHFSKVCMKLKASKNTQNSNSNNQPTSASMSVISSLSKAPQCLAKALVQVKINDIPAYSLVDTGSSESYLNADFALRNKLEIFQCGGQVCMATTSATSKIRGYCLIRLELLQNVYTNLKISILADLCADFIIGHDIMKQHTRVDVVFGGSRPPLSICCLMEAKVERPLLFGNLTEDCRPIATKSRRHSDEDETFIREEIKNLLKENIIEESTSPWRAQVLVVKNENHKKRMVVDYSQTINRFTLLDAYPLPNIEQIVSKVSKYEVFSTIDLKSAYHQIPIRDIDKPYTGFEAGGRLYQFCRIPFGVTNGVSCFQRVIDNIINNEQLTGVFAYLDDVTVCGVTQDDHDLNLNSFLAAIKKYGLTINESKCNYSKRSINLLGYTIQNKTLKPDQERLAPLLNLPVPENKEALRRALGMFAHYSKWIPKFSNKIRSLIDCKQFPMSSNAVADFEKLKLDIANSLVSTITGTEQLVVETDASDYAIAAILSQAGRPVAFHSRTLTPCEQRHSSIEKEAYAIVEALRKWRHLLIGRHFKLITDQESVSFMFNSKHASKIKNDKIKRWRLELACYNYDIVYRPGKSNTVADAFSRICNTISNDKLFEIHQDLCHPGVTRMYHFVRIRNLPFSLEDVKRINSTCPICAEIKPNFFKKTNSHLIKATSPFERLNIDFKGPLPSSTNKKYLLTIVDEYSRFPFAIPCSDTSSSTVISCLQQIFVIFGMPAYIHSDRGSVFISKEITSYLHSKGIATSRSTPYNPEGNGQVERYNGIIWRAISLAIKTRGLQISQWEIVLADALHSIRSLLCTATNCTPHERMFNHQRRSTNGISLPSWLTQNQTVFLKKHVRDTKYEPLVEEVELLEANPEYAFIRHQNGRESTVSLKHLAPRGDTSLTTQDPVSLKHLAPGGDTSLTTINDAPTIIPDEVTENSQETVNEVSENSCQANGENDNDHQLRRSSRSRNPPKYLLDYQ